MVQGSGPTCRLCGRGLNADARFCPECGAAVPRFCGMCGAQRTSQARFCPECGFGFADGSSAALAAPPAAPPSVPAAPPVIAATPPTATPGIAPAPPTPEPLRPLAARQAPGARVPRRPIPPVVLALAAVVVLAAGALGTGIVKLPGAANGTVTGSGKIDDPTPPSGPVQSPLPIDNLATRAQGTLTLGDASPVETINLAADGASPTVSAPGQPWDGLPIDLPAGDWSGSTLICPAAPITDSSFGELVTPISPLYAVSGAKGMAPVQ